MHAGTVRRFLLSLLIHSMIIYNDSTISTIVKYTKKKRGNTKDAQLAPLCYTFRDWCIPQ